MSLNHDGQDTGGLNLPGTSKNIQTAEEEAVASDDDTSSAREWLETTIVFGGRIR
ncbi:hypothetical protein FRC02_001638 [Tulasnella sp. 418]|nr:hypothetical protein FRC02_001638 [Tulasnella sp. 418]